ncbi:MULTISPECIES: BsuPI-related putative proteinase inhibitor [Halolamina]|uniref:Intracellular proteinase inhibitor n=1 Tax=Halolamina pelagica TaxID=699431 RepID=A0A1I5M465_9EURY|nr:MULTISPECIES: BsuPI-related putative proteinase inhibitor [Halolamina]NHX35833.1 hypothetical protein [Halolamina sp. R1-12]SFP03736.1 Intracellular proteinase inhibitor [Halolamina pelagica]
MLETSLESRQRGDALAFELTVENTDDGPVELSFADAQRVRVSVYPAGADDEAAPVWQSDADRMFAQVTGSETVPAGGSRTFDAAWEDPDPGEYFVVAELTCRDRELSAEETVLV